MASSTIRKAIGAVKDQTSISLAKVAGTVAPDLEVLVVKATTHDSEAADEKYIREISNMVSYSNGYLRACILALSKRLGKTRDWIVALKSLMLVHRLLSDGDPAFGQELMSASHKGMRILNMSGFRDEAHSSSWDHSGFVKAYGQYLDQKLEFMVYERKLGIMGYGTNRRTWSSGNTNEAYRQRPKNLVKWMDFEPEIVLERLNQFLLLLERFLAARPTGAAQNTRMVLVALYLLVKDSFGLYADVSEMLNNLLERFTNLDYASCVKAFDAYVNAAKSIGELVMFYNWCKDAGVARPSQYPEVQPISNKLLEILERLLREKGNKPKRVSEPREETSSEIPEEKQQSVFEVKALPPPDYSDDPPDIRHPQDEQQNQVITEDLLNLKDDCVSADVQGNNMALALFSTPNSSNTNNGWVEFPVDGQAKVTSAWEHPAAETGKSNWEVELVELASQLSLQKAQLPGGFDPLLLDGMYDQGAVMQYSKNSHLSNGSASGAAFPAMGKTTSQVLALPAPDGTIQPRQQQDPFAASLAVPPPSYVQIADMERKQQLLIQEQQLWQQYENSGMQGEMGLSQIATASTYYPAAMQFIHPHGMP